MELEIQHILKLPNPPLPVHRLDKVSREYTTSFLIYIPCPQATTGVLMLATNETSARHISRQIQSDLVNKSYLAIVRGFFRKEDTGIIEAPLAQDGKYSKVDKDGKMTQTVGLISCSTSKFFLG